MTESKKPEIEKVRISAEDMMKIWGLMENPPEPKDELKLALKLNREFLGKMTKEDLEIKKQEREEAKKEFLEIVKKIKPVPSTEPIVETIRKMRAERDAKIMRAVRNEP